jgi:hypothetical protein
LSFIESFRLTALYDENVYTERIGAFESNEEIFQSIEFAIQERGVYAYEVFSDRLAQLQKAIDGEQVKISQLPYKFAAISLNKSKYKQTITPDLIIKAIKIITETLKEDNPNHVITAFLHEVGRFDLVQLTKKPKQFFSEIKKTNYMSIAIGSEILASIAANLWLTEERYKKYEAAYLESMPKIMSSSRAYPTIRGSLEGTEYSWESMDMGNPRGWFVGLETNCCQHIEGAGSSCVMFAAQNPEISGMFRVMKKNKTVAQSWFWYDAEKGDFVFDNIEVLGKEIHDHIWSCYKEFVMEGLRPRAKLFGIKRVCIGLGCNDMSTIVTKLPRIINASDVNHISNITDSGASHVYSDALNQVLMEAFNISKCNQQERAGQYSANDEEYCEEAKYGA